MSCLRGSFFPEDQKVVEQIGVQTAGLLISTNVAIDPNRLSSLRLFLRASASWLALIKQSVLIKDACGGIATH